MDKLKAFESFVSVALKGSLTAAANAEGVAPAIMGPRLDSLEAFAAPPNGIYAVFSQRKYLPLRLRLWIDFLKDHYGQATYWSGT